MKRRFVRLTIFALLMLPVFAVTPQPKPDTEERYSVEVAEVYATSFVASETDNIFRYHPVMAFDGNPTTSWNEGAYGSGINESLSIAFFDDIMIDAIAVMPGYYDKRWYAANNRIKNLGVQLRSLDGSLPEFIGDFADGMEVKWVRIPPQKMTGVDFKIREVYPGSQYDDTCISEISFYFKNKRIYLHGIDGFLRLLKDNKDFSTPSGFVIYSIPYSNYPDAYYFFPDGVCLTGDMLDAAGSVKKGTWKYVLETDQIDMHFSVQEVFEGVGDSVYEKPDMKTISPRYYEDYKYYVKPIDESTYETWTEFRGGPEGYSSFVCRLLTSRDYKLHTIPRPDYREKIESLRQKYREAAGKR